MQLMGCIISGKGLQRPTEKLKLNPNTDNLCTQVQMLSSVSPLPPLIKNWKPWLGFDWFPLKWHIMAFRFKWGKWRGGSFSCCSRPFCQINPDSVPNSVSKSHQSLRFPWAVRGGVCAAATWLLKSPEGSAEITRPSAPSNCLDAHMSPNLAFICDDRDLICSDGLDTISLRVTFNDSVPRYGSKDSHCSSPQLKSWYTLEL